MTKEVEIKALRPFNKHERGDMCEVGETFPVSETRAGQLEAAGLARRTKAAPAPENKMAVEPANKATAPGRKPITIAPQT